MNGGDEVIEEGEQLGSGGPGPLWEVRVAETVKVGGDHRPNLRQWSHELAPVKRRRRETMKEENRFPRPSLPIEDPVPIDFYECSSLSRVFERQTLRQK